MKKALALFCTFSLFLGILAGCDRNKPESVPESQSESSVSEAEASSKPASDYKDGEYSASYKTMAIDRTLDFMTISVSDGKLSIKEYSCKEDTTGGGSVTGAPAASQAASSAAASTASATGATDAEKLAQKQMDKVKEEYDTMGGDLEALQNAPDADEHTYRFIRMMRMLQEAAKKGDTSPLEFGRYADGSYKAVMPTANAEGWVDYIKLTVKDSEIAELEFNASKASDANVLITNDPEANKGTNKPSVYYPQIAKSFTEAGGDLSKIFAPTGGGAATKTFGKLMRPMLGNLVSGAKTDMVAPLYVSGTYKAEFTDFDAYGWKDYVVLSISNDVVTVDEFDAVSKEDAKLKKSASDESSKKMKEKTGLTPLEASAELMSRWTGAKNDATAVENVAGATVSSNSFKLLVGEILATSALEGDTQATLTVERLK